MPKHASSGKYAIVGLGVVAGPQPDPANAWSRRRPRALAIADAGLTPKQIDGAIDLRRTGGGGDRAAMSTPIPRVLGLNNCFYFVVGRGGALAGLGIATAMSFIDRGIADYVCLVGAVTDWSQAQESERRVIAAWPMSRRQATGARRSATCAPSAITAGWRRATWRYTAPPAAN